jgi:hypothetical protein
MSGIEQGKNHMAADIPCPTGNENVHGSTKPAVQLVVRVGVLVLDSEIKRPV